MFIVFPSISSTGLVILAEVNLRCGNFLSEKICRHSTGSFFSFLLLTTRHSLSFHKFERLSCLFGVDNAFFTCRCYLELLNYWFQFFFCGIMSFYVSISDAFFSRYKFFHFSSQCLADNIIALCSFLFIYSILLG